MSNFASRPGRPLPDNVRQKMESFFNTDFSDVQIHVGQEASSIGALAFTQGSHLYFAPGQYNPNSHQGQQLLGHELTHVLQQRAGRVRNPFGSGVAVVQDIAMEPRPTAWADSPRCTTGDSRSFSDCGRIVRKEHQTNGDSIAPGIASIESADPV